MEKNRGNIFCGDCTELISTKIDDKSIQLTMTSPPYFNTGKKYQRGKGVHYSKDIGEPLYTIIDCARALYPKTRHDGFFCLNLGFSYAETGVLRPFYIAQQILKETTWQIVDTCVWHKNNPIPIKGRHTNAFEYVFVFSPNPIVKYPWYKDHPDDYIHNVIKMPVSQGKGGIPVFPPELPKFFIKIFSSPNDIVCDPFLGSGTTVIEAKKLGRKYIGFDINQEYVELARKDLEKTKAPKIDPKTMIIEDQGLQKWFT